MVDKTNQPDVKRRQTDFFSIGVEQKPKIQVIEEVKEWKNIRPKQDYDAVNRQAFKKRKYDER